MQTRIYLIDESGDDREKAPTTRLIEATSQAQALRHVATARFMVRPASPQDVAAAMGVGVKLETAAKE